MKRILTAGLAAFALGATGFSAIAQEQPSTILVLDASGSMWGQIDGVNKIVIAREVVADILSDFPAGQNLGFVTYGHRERGQCSDIETVIAPASGTAPEIVRIVNDLNPRGMTPMTDAVIVAAQALRHTEQAATVILVSDGIETCNPDPCAAARALEQSGIDFTAHVIGFDVAGEAEALMQMQCIAAETGGRFLTADNAQELSDALQQVVAIPAPIPATAELTLRAVMNSENGPLVETPVIWNLDMEEDGFEFDGNPGLVDLQQGSWHVSGYHMVLEQEKTVQLTIAEGQPLTYTMVFEEPEPTSPQAMVSAPAQVVIGSEFAVNWEAEGLDPRDYVTIVPAGAEDGAYTDYDRLQDREEGRLRAPAEPGLYEVRLQTQGEGRVLATAPVEVIDVEVTVSAPAQVVVGSAFPVSWEAEGLYPRDYVTIVPAGAEDGAYTDYDRMEGQTEGRLRAPAEPGLYEVRLQMEGSGRVLATTPIEVVDADVVVSAPAGVLVGSEFAVTWVAEGLHPRDYVTIVPAGAEDGAYTDYDRMEGQTEGRLRAPAEPGLYEVRLQMEGSGRVLATTPIEVMEGNVTVTGPDRVRADTEMTLVWTDAIYPRDYVTIVPAETEDGQYADYIRVGSADQGKMAAPSEPGLYEIRYHLERDGRVMARQALEVLAADAPMDHGAGLVVPASANPGDTINVTWTGGTESADQRVTLARADQADFSWISAESAIGRDSIELILPDAPGTYEVRFLDVAGRSVLGRSIIEVQP